MPVPPDGEPGSKQRLLPARLLAWPFPALSPAAPRRRCGRRRRIRRRPAAHATRVGGRATRRGVAGLRFRRAQEPLPPGLLPPGGVRAPPGEALLALDEGGPVGPPPLPEYPP